MNKWQIVNNKLTKTFEFNNFLKALDFVNKVGKLAEENKHHPDIKIFDYKYVEITLLTHDSNKVTDKDYNLAKQIDALN